MAENCGPVDAHRIIGGRLTGKRRHADRKQMEETRVPEHVWKRFSPDVPDKTKCYARLWAGGRGAQCNRFPISGRALCGMHSNRGAPHGLVNGAIPYEKLQEFLRAEEKRGNMLRKRAATAEGVKGGAKRRLDRRKRHWYARFVLWSEAMKLDTEERRSQCGPLESVDDLGDAEFTDCLERVNEYIGLHRPLQHHAGTTSSGCIELDQ